MKKLLVTSVALGVGFLLASTASAVITGSKHDMSSTGPDTIGGNNSNDELCIFCHTPHNADTTVGDAPLWNHEVTGSSFTPYSSTTLDAGPLGQPDGVSKLCLSCHDGTLAMDAFGGDAGTSVLMGGMGTGSGDLGTDLSNDHPISFVYDGALVTADGGLNDPTVAPISGWLFTGGLLECASCHAVYNDGGGVPMLRVTNVGSALCLTCHDK